MRVESAPRALFFVAFAVAPPPCYWASFLSSLLFAAFRSAARGGASPLSPPPPHAGDAHAARDASALRTCMWNPRAGRFRLAWWACGSVGLWAVVVSSYRQSLCFRFIPA